MKSGGCAIMLITVLLSIMIMSVTLTQRYSDRNVQYTDSEAKFLAQFLTIVSPAGPFYAKPLLEALTIITPRLKIIGRQIGNCYDMAIYDLSHSYILFVDNNACYTPRVSIERKAPCVTGSLPVNATVIQRIVCAEYERALTAIPSVNQ
jgi:hypothetical protein